MNLYVNEYSKGTQSVIKSMVIKALEEQGLNTEENVDNAMDSKVQDLGDLLGNGDILVINALELDYMNSDQYKEDFDKKVKDKVKELFGEKFEIDMTKILEKGENNNGKQYQKI